MLGREKTSLQRPDPTRASDADLPIVFAPGLSCDERLWNKTRALLGDRACCIVDFAAQTSIEAMACEILNLKVPRFVLAGFSMGGMAALVAASNAPCRVAGLVIICTHAEVDTAEREAARKRQLAFAGACSFDAYVMDELLPSYFSNPHARAVFGPCLADMALALGPDVFVRQVEALMARPDLAELAGRVRCPAIVLSGEHDKLAPPVLAARLAAKMHAEFVIVPDCGHILPLECPSAVANAIDYLQARLAVKECLE